MIARSILLRSCCFLTLGLLVALPDLAEARGAGRSGKGGGGRATSAGRPASGFSGGAPGRFTAGVPQPRQAGPRQAKPSQARPTPAAPRPGSLPSAFPTTRDVQSLLGQGLPQAAQAQALQTGSFSPEQAVAKFDSATASANAQSAVSDFQNSFQSGPEPLSPAWYAEHPTAWQATHPHADTVAVASAAAVTSWIAYGNYPATSTVVYDDSSTTIVYEEAAPTTGAEPQPVYAAPAPTESAPVEPSEESDAESATGEWLNLGVYEVKPTPDAAATQRHQLSVNRDGTLKGIYHDQLTGAVEGLSGRIDSVTQQATWWLDINPAGTFTTSLDSLTATTGSVTLTLPAGEQVLTISREETL